MDRVRHKGSNRFKFQSFAERISNVNIDIFHRVPHRNEEDEEENSTYLYQAVQKWCALNLTENFRSFRQDIGYEINTLPQLLNHKEKIVSVFIKNIKLQNVISLEPVLEMLVAFVKDIRSEFYQFYPEILRELILLLEVKDPQILESTFTCLAYIFKFLTRELVRDLDKVLLDLAPLLNDENPAYVRDFAAQSFAFVARKVKDKEKFLLLILQTVQKSPHLLNGSSQLIFHMMCGIRGQSHSCAEELFFTIFNAFGNVDLPQKLLYSLTKNIIISYGNAIGPQHSILFAVLHRVLKEKVVKDGDSSKSVKQLLKIMKVSLQCRSGANLQESLIPEVTSCVSKLLSSSNIKIQRLCAEICGDVLILNKLKIPQEIASLLVIKVLETKEEKILMDFMEQVINFSSFEALVLPQALQIFCTMDSRAFLRTLAKIIITKTETQTKTYKISDAPVYAIALRNSSIRLRDILLSIMEQFNPESEMTDDILYALIIIRHLKPVDEAVVSKTLLDVIGRTVRCISDVTAKDKRLFILCTAFESLFYFRGGLRRDDVEHSDTFSRILALLTKSRCIVLLRIVNLLLTIVEDVKISDDLFSESYQNIEKMVQTPHSYSRFLALHSLQCLEKLRLTHNEESGKSMVEVLDLCLSAETIPLTINDYREKIKELQKLKYESLPALTDRNYQVIIRYLLGALYCNFQLLWEPISEILATYASNIPKSFWTVFYKQLCHVTEVCKERKIPDEFDIPDLVDEFLLRAARFVKVEDKPDYGNYRYLMWKAMTLFVDLCETKNRDVVSMYLAFLRDEFLKSSPQHGMTINIKQKDAIEDVEDVHDKMETSNVESAVKSGSSGTIKWAVAHLNLLSNFKSPRLCYKEAEVLNSYYELLEHRNTEIQKLALECLFTYKFKYMVPYKENLRNLIDDAKFKDEIVHFQIDQESSVIQENHREELMPVVMRILYTKMVSRTATKRGSKGSAALLKRSVVFRFLAGCSESEMEVFLHMAFRSFQSYQEADSFAFIEIMKSVDLERVTPPKKLLGVVNLAEVIIEHFGGLMTVKIQRYILKILFSVGAVTSGIFAQREKVFSGYMTSMKNLRTTIADCLAKFFDRLSFPWSEDEINSVFEIFVWDGLEKLPVEGFYNPTAVLRLFSTWSENPRYHKLLARHKKQDESVSPLPFVMKLLLNEKTQSSVTSCITGIIEKLLTLKEGVTDEAPDDKPLEVDYLLPVDESQIERLSLKEELNCGSKILLPHVGSVLSYLRRKLEKSSNVLQRTELSILARVTELATSPENADALMTILLRLLTGRKQTDEEILMETMSTVENLSRIVTKPLSYLKSFAMLLGILEGLEARRSLVNALLHIQSRCPEVDECVNVVRDLNANDSKWVDQPDYDKRIDAYKKAKTLAGDGKMDVNFAAMVLHNCFFVVRCDTDFSLRDSASHCLKEICPMLAKAWKENKAENQFWIDSILKLAHRAIVGQDENLQSFAISLLGVMARECGDLHPVLRDLSVYTNKSDLEVDLFENAIHLQGHRRLRALLRFCSLSKTLTKPPNTRTLVQFILPLATRYLCCEKYAGKNSLIDAAISCLGAVCRFLPWQKYQTILRYYLSKFQGKMEYQRQLVRVVIAILDSFHFDTSKAKEAAVAPRPEAEDEKTVADASAPETPIDGEEALPLAIDDEGDEAENADTSGDEPRGKELLDELHGDDNLKPEGEVMMEDKGTKKTPAGTTLAYQAITILSPAEAVRVEGAMSGSLLSQLTKAIGQKTQVEDTHKTNLKSLGPERDQEEVARIPIAVTLVKLLQKISTKILEDHLPGILMRLCTFLKSKMESVRRATRETLQQIMSALGPKYLRVIMSEMTSALTKGFQLHVLVFTVHAVIQSVRSQLQPGDIDENIPALMEICKTDIFGLPSEEKAVVQIQVKHKEVRSTKSYPLMNLIAQYVTEKCLTDILMPVKEVLSTSHSHKAITKCRECLRHVVSGLCANEFISTENLFIYVYGVTSESIPKLCAPEKVEEKKKNPKERRDCFIIPEEPKSRTGVLSNPVKKNPKSNAHVLLEFGFQLLQFLLKKDKLKSTPNFKSMLDPHGPILVKAVQSQHVKVSTLALNCLCKMFKLDLPSVRAEVKSVVNELFAILHKYAAPGLCKGETFDLVLVSFKAICVIMRDTHCAGFDEDKLKILLVYVEQDVYDNQRQASAFNLLKTVLRKKLNVPELGALIRKVAELSVSSELAHVRLQARQSVLQYVMEYPLPKPEVEFFIGFYASQLKFEVESGRQSALEMIHSFITNFPQEVLNELCGVFLITLGARLVNDDSPECRKAVSGIVKSMLMRLNQKYRDQLFQIVLLWLKQEKVNHRRLAAQITGIFVTMEKGDFAKRLPKLLPLIREQFMGGSRPGKFVRLPEANEEKEKMMDYHLFQVLQLLLKMCTHCRQFLTDAECQESVHLFTETSQSLLCHPHEWVRLAAMQFLGSVFNSIDPTKVSSVLNGGSPEAGVSFLEESSLSRRVRSLILDHVSQLIPGAALGQEFIEQVTKNLVYFARVLKDVKAETLANDKAEEKEDEVEDAEGKAPKKLTMLWLIRKMRGVVNKEVAETPRSYVLRTAVLKWIGAVGVCFTRDELLGVLYHLIAPVVRERDLLKGENSKSPIKDLVNEVTGVLKKKVGVEEFTAEAVKIRKRLQEKRTERRTQRAEEFVTNPERAAKRKIEKQLKKKMSKKRKIEAFKAAGTKRFGRKRKAEEDEFL